MRQTFAVLFDGLGVIFVFEKSVSGSLVGIGVLLRRRLGAGGVRFVRRRRRSLLVVRSVGDRNRKVGLSRRVVDGRGRLAVGRLPVNVHGAAAVHGVFGVCGKAFALFRGEV